MIVLFNPVLFVITLCRFTDSRGGAHITTVKFQRAWRFLRLPLRSLLSFFRSFRNARIYPTEGVSWRGDRDSIDGRKKIE